MIKTLFKYGLVFGAGAYSYKLYSGFKNNHTTLKDHLTQLKSDIAEGLYFASFTTSHLSRYKIAFNGEYFHIRTILAEHAKRFKDDVEHIWFSGSNKYGNARIAFIFDIHHFDETVMFKDKLCEYLEDCRKSLNFIYNNNLGISPEKTYYID